MWKKSVSSHWHTCRRHRPGVVKIKKFNFGKKTLSTPSKDFGSIRKLYAKEVDRRLMIVIASDVKVSLWVEKRDGTRARASTEVTFCMSWMSSENNK